MTELYTLHASEGPWLHGPYSRFGWHHPGPLLFYLYAPWYALSGRHSGAINASALLINAMAVATIVWLLARRRDDAVSWTILGAVALFVWRFGGVASSAWNPHVLVLPFSAILVCAAAVASGEAAAMLPMIILASLVTQSHLGTIPVVGVAMLVSLAAVAKNHRREPVFRRAVMRSAAAALVIWLPSMVEAFSGNPGNPARIYAFLASADAGHRVEGWPALWAWADLVTAMWSGDPIVQSGDVYMPSGGAVALAMATLQTAVLPLVAWWARGSGRPRLGWLAIVVMAASLTAFAALHRQWRIEGVIQVHTSLWLLPIGALNLAAIAAVAASFAAPLLPRARQMLARAFAPACAAALVLLVAWHGYQFARLRENALRASRHATDTDRVVENTARFLRDRGLSRPLVVVEAPVWHHTAAVVLDLARSGTEVAVQPELQSMFGAPLVKDTPRDVIIRIVDRAGADEVQRQPGRELVIARDSVLVYALPPAAATSPVP
jgi:hypothetical protein